LLLMTQFLNCNISSRVIPNLPANFEKINDDRIIRLFTE
jgi:hypothetical protein